MTDPFKLLGLDRKTATQKDVKAAYARLLKVTRPEDDPDAFMALRAAFETARGTARANDTRAAAKAAKSDTRNAAPVEAQTPPAAKQTTQTQTKKSPPPAPAPQKEPEPVRWHFDETLNWDFNSSAQGVLVEETIRWMVAGGPDAKAFTARVAEHLIADDNVDTEAYRTEVLNYLAVASDPEEEAQERPVWEAITATRPEWLSDDLIRALHGDLGLLRVTPEGAYMARSYNSVRAMFAPALEDVPDPLDVDSVFERELTEQRSDDHGSYFDKKTRKWVDMSPVTVAMRDLEASFGKDWWNMEQVCREILNRDNIQALEDFQNLDARLRAYFCQATGFGHGKTPPLHPGWMTKPVVLLFDDTFGWSRQFGRNHWERQQYAWLHRIIARHRDVKQQTQQFQAMSQGRHQAKGAGYSIYGWLFRNPVRLLVAYAAYRVLQILMRLVT